MKHKEHKPEETTPEVVNEFAHEADLGEEFRIEQSEIPGGTEIAPEDIPEPPKMPTNPEDHPNWTRPGTPKHPKQIILHRADAVGARQRQSAVILEPDTVGEVLISAHVPAGYEILSPLTGEILSHGELLYDHVIHNGTVELIGE